MSNQRPASVPEFLYTAERSGTKYMHIDEEGVCDACWQANRKEAIDWPRREEELYVLLDRFHSKYGSNDCLVPGSGGKDSGYAAHLLKYKYGMHPLTVTWPPTLYTDYGYRNFMNWVNVGGFDNISFRPNGQVHCKLTSLAVRNLLYPFQIFILGQKGLAPKIALNYGISLIFYGENEAEYGNPIAENSTSLRDKSYFTVKNLDSIRLAGYTLRQLEQEHGSTLGDLQVYLPADPDELGVSNIEVYYLGYYVKWTPQEAFYYAVENCGFQPRPFRSEGTYRIYNCIDDKIDDLHYYTTHIKFGLGRASCDASQEIHNHHLTREEGVALARQFDGERPRRYLGEVLDYLGLSEDEFDALCDRFRSPHLWEKPDGEWALRLPVWAEEA